MESGSAAVVNARQQWHDGYRRLEQLRGDPDLYHALLDRVSLITDELRRRVGAHYTLTDLAAAYRDADRWASDVVVGHAQGMRYAAHATLVEDVAFHLYARGAVDYEP